MAEEVAGIPVDGVHGHEGKPFMRDCPEEVAWQLGHAGAPTRDATHAACDLASLRGWNRHQGSSHFAKPVLH